MILRVGPFLYRVRFVDGYIDHEGEKCLGLCDNDAHELLVSTVVSEAQQIQVISHEYMEAWLYHFGASVTDKEDYCDLFGMAMTQFVLDLTRQLRIFAGEAAEGAVEADADPADALVSTASTSASQAPADVDTMLRCLGEAARASDTANREAPATPSPRVATKLARQAARVGLRVRDVYEGK
ncbi:MAG: hypothetical protein WD534_14375 [Phycisphaeraceae bacterium]